MSNFSDNFLRDQKNEIVIDDFAYQYDDDAQDVYAIGGDTTAVAIDTDDSHAVSKTRLKMTMTKSSGTATLTGTLPTVDLSDLVGVTSGAPTKGFIKLIQERNAGSSGIVNVSIQLGNDSSNYVTWGVGAPSQQNTPITYKIPMSGLAMTGTVNWRQIDYVKITATLTSGTAVILYFSGLRVESNTGVTGGIWRERVDLHTTGQSAFNLVTKNDQVGILFANGFNLRTVHDIPNRLYLNGQVTAKVTAVTNGPTYGVAFRLQQTDLGAQNGYMVDFTSSAVRLLKAVNGSITTLSANSNHGLTISSGQPYWLRVSFNGNRFRGFISEDGKNYIKCFDMTDSTFALAGTVGVFKSSTNSYILNYFEVVDGPYVAFGDWSFGQLGQVTTTKPAQEDQAPRLDMQTEALANTDKDIFENRNWRSKFVTVEAQLMTQSAGEMTNAIDDLKYHLGQVQQILRVGKQTDLGDFDERYYIADAINLDSILQRSPGDTQHVGPFSVVFQAVDGIATKGSKSINTFTFDEAVFTRNIKFDGSAGPLPLLTLTLTDATGSSTLANIEIISLTTGKTITVNSASTYADGDVVELDFKNQTVKVNGTEVAYTGFIDATFFDTGNNEVQFTLYAADSIIAQNAIPTLSAFEVFNDQVLVDFAQSFVAPETTTITRVDIYGKIDPAKLSGTQLQIRADNAGAPTGTLLGSDFTSQFPRKDVFTWLTQIFATPASITSGNTYWFRTNNHTTAYNANKIVLKGTKDNSFSTGLLKKTTDNGSTWANAFGSSNYDLSFRIWKALPTSITGTLAISYEPRYI